MKLSTKIKSLQAQINELHEKEKEFGGVLFYDAQTGEFKGAYNWKPGEPHTREMKLTEGGRPCPVGFTGTMLIDDIMED